MCTKIEELLDSIGVIGEFHPCAGSYPAMDMIVIQKEDVSYRSDYFGPAFSVLRAPDEERVVGFKIEGADFVVRSARQMLCLGPSDAVPLRTLAFLAALTSWPTPLPMRHRDVLEDIESFFRDEDLRDVGLTPAQWGSIAAMTA